MGKIPIVGNKTIVGKAMLPGLTLSPHTSGGGSTDEAVGRAVARCTEVSTTKFKDCDLKAEDCVVIVYYFDQDQEHILMYTKELYYKLY